jgi:ABC-type oligopeptide transport system substrate-binding subunit
LELNMGLFWYRSLCALVLGVAVAASHGAGSAAAGWSHAFAMYGTPKYPAGFAHYDYVNPDAPKGGTLNLGNPDRGTSFSLLNPYLLNTQYSYGTYFFSFETLCDPSEDEAGVMYGLVAEAILVAPDLSSVSFRINPRAHFNNGDPVTAADVKYSFDTLVSDQANPGYAATLALASRAVVIDARTIRFDLAGRSRDSVYTLGTFLRVFSPKWGMGADGKRKPFSKIIDDLPIGTGAYLVARTYNGRRIDLVRDPNYWARDEGVRRGYYNFDKIVYRYYADNSVQFEALKAGDIDLFWETNLKRWGRQYKGDKFGPGKIVLEALPTGQGTYPRALILNVRRPKFRDARVREALQLSFDFEWLNAQNSISSRASTAPSATRSSPPAGCPRPASSPSSSRSGRACLPRCSGLPTRTRAPTLRRWRCARTSSAPATCSPKPAGGPAPTASCAMTGASRSPSKCSTTTPTSAPTSSPGWSTSRVSASTPASGRSTSRCSTSASTSSTST